MKLLICSIRMRERDNVMASSIGNAATKMTNVHARPQTAVDKRTISPGREERDPVRFRRRRRRLELGLAWIAPLAFIAMWDWASRTGILNPIFFPPPSEVWSTGVSLAWEGTLQHHLWLSLQRVFYGYLLGVTAGMFVGIMMGTFRSIRAGLDGLLTALYMVPKLAILPLLLLIFGLGEEPKVLMIAITIFFFQWLTTMAAFIGVPQGYGDAARSFGANRLQRFVHVDFQAALPSIFVALRLNVGVAMLVVVSVEFIQSSNGIGWLIWNSWTLLATRQMYAGIVVVSVTGVLLTMAVRFMGRLAAPWSTGDDRDGSP